MDKIKELKKEIDFLYLYPQASMNVIRRKEKELEDLKGDLK